VFERDLLPGFCAARMHIKQAIRAKNRQQLNQSLRYAKTRPPAPFFAAIDSPAPSRDKRRQRFT
jgi:hypothetical protein